MSTHEDEDEEQQEDNNVVIVVLLAIFTYISQVVSACTAIIDRNPSLFEQRMLWNRIIERHSGRFPFKRHLRMEVESFDKLLSYIRADLEVDQRMAALRGGAILPEICLYITLRWLAGGSYSDIYMFAGISSASFYRVLWKTINAINKCEHLLIKFPQSMSECQQAAAGFESISTSRVITNCVSVVDGFLLRVVTPPSHIVGNVRSYFSGHYQCYGVNVQAACDHLSRFTYFAVAGPGVMPDQNAKSQVDLDSLVEKLPTGYCVIADCAYVASEHWVPVYSGALKNRPTYDNFNYYASQLRIRIEMAFGLMTRKFGILWRELTVDIRRVKVVAMCVAKLHNYCINERMRMQGIPDPCAEQGISGRGDMEATSEAAAEVEYDERGFPGWSELREEMALRVKYLGLTRPVRSRQNLNNKRTSEG